MHAAEEETDMRKQTCLRSRESFYVNNSGRMHAAMLCVENNSDVIEASRRLKTLYKPKRVYIRRPLEEIL